MAMIPLDMRILLSGFVFRKMNMKDRDWKTFSMLHIFGQQKLTGENFDAKKGK
jgi:hypothetical protein